MKKFEITFPPARRPEDPLGDMEDRFAEFVTTKHVYTADQLRAAYEGLLGASELEIKNPGMKILLEEMRRLEKAGFPVNRFAAMVGVLQKIEDAEPLYLSYVESLPITEEEKTLLCAIVIEKRKGLLEVSADGKVFARIDLDVVSEDDIETELLNALKRVMMLAEKEKKKDLEFTLTS